MKQRNGRFTPATMGRSVDRAESMYPNDKNNQTSQEDSPRPCPTSVSLTHDAANAGVSSSRIPGGGRDGRDAHRSSDRSPFRSALQSFRGPPMTETNPDSMQQFWTRTPDTLCAELRCSRDGLSTQDAEARLGRYGPNADAAAKPTSLFSAVARRLLEPLSLILLAAGIVSAVTGDTIGGSIIVMILAFSIGLDTIQEGHAVNAAEILRRSLALKTEVKRDGSFRSVAVEAVVPGDVLRRPARRPARRDRGRSGWRPRRIGRCAGGRSGRRRARLEARRPPPLRLQPQTWIGAGVWPRRPIADRQGRA